MSERSEIASSAAPVLSRSAQGSRCVAPTQPRGAFFFAFFLLGKQKKEGRVRAAARFQKTSKQNDN
jgi:hypothetical protein